MAVTPEVSHTPLCPLSFRLPLVVARRYTTPLALDSVEAFIVWEQI